jgi:transposase InsO family protein
LCTDITYLYFALGRIAYLSVIKDLATGEILAWKLSLSLELEFVIATVRQLKVEELASDCDQGCHYTSLRYQEAVKELSIAISMSRKGNCIDNAPMESFFGHLKDELEFKACRTFEELTIKVSEYMQYYNHNRYQWGLNKMTPAEYRDHLVAVRAA